ncbi:hypothetical protein MKX01_020476, partial [Papaver californicum]
IPNYFFLLFLSRIRVHNTLNLLNLKGNLCSPQQRLHGGATSFHCDRWIGLCIVALDRNFRSRKCTWNV